MAAAFNSSGRKSDNLPIRSKNPDRRKKRTIVQAVIEALEPRILLSQVTNTNPGGTGSLQAAISLASTGDQTITFLPGLTGTITLGGNALAISNTTGKLTIQGPGAGSLTINANHQSKVFTVGAGSNVEIEGLTIANGGFTNDPGGGGIANNGNTTISNCLIINNLGTGGGISNSPVGKGGHANLYILNSTISENTGNGPGGGITNTGSLTIGDSTISGNSAANGAGIFNGSALFLYDSTVTGNVASGVGGGIANYTGATVVDSTIAGNSATSGGGIDTGLSTATTTLDGTIVASTSGGDLAGPGTFTGTHNLIQDASGSRFNSASSNNLSGNPNLSTLGNYGGPTETMVLLPGSRAIGAGSTFIDHNGNQIIADQRGMPRPLGSSYDIGAFQTQGNLSLVVNTTLDDPIGPNTLSLRDAINLANILAGNQTVTFSPALTQNGATTIALDGNALEITNNSANVTVQGPGAGLLVIDGANKSDVFTVDAGDCNATIEGLTITGGIGGIEAGGRLIVNNCTVTGNDGSGISVGGGRSFGVTVYDSTISNNTSAAYGGGISCSGPLTIANSTISNNRGASGGGIFDGFFSEITNCTISGNIAADNGGGIANYYNAQITDSTIANNTAHSGGGIANFGNTVSLNGTIVAGNQGGDLADGNFTGTYNLIEDNSGSSNGLTDPTNKTGNPLLGPLAFNGGPIQTMALLPPSPLISDPGYGISLIAMDQRGFARPTNTSSNIGAFQSQGGNSLVVNTTEDDPASPGLLTLRDAIKLAEEFGGNRTITFDPSLTGQTITLNGSALALDDTGGTLTLQGPTTGSLTISAHGQSGVLTVSGAAQVNNLIITGGNSAGNGGGIQNLGNLTIHASTIEQNSATYDGGGVYSGSGSNLTITNSTISGNTSDNRFGGGVYSFGGSYLAVSDSTISGNTATWGGGILAYGVAMITDSTISGNTASLEGGGLYSNTLLTVADSTFTNNVSDYGGGAIAAFGFTTVTGSTFNGNEADLPGFPGSGGGAIDNEGTLVVDNSTFATNSANQGGAIFAYSPSTSITDSTLSGNSATDSRGGGGIYGSATIDGTIVANSIHGHDLSGTFSGNHNLIMDGSPVTGSSNIQGNPLLAPLGNYGGSTQTMALLPGSPAMDAGAVFPGPGGAAIATDQRGVGFSRDIGAAPDIGAFESNGFVITPAGGTQHAPVNSAFTNLTVLVTANDPSLSNLTNGIITFTPPGSGASAVLGATTATISDIAGTNSASVTASANGTAGSYSVFASGQPSTLGAAGEFSLTNLSAASPMVSISGIPVVTEGNPVTFSATATPASPGDSLTYNWSVLKNGQPFGLSSNGTPSITFMPDGLGNWSVGVTVTDTTQNSSATTTTGTFPVAGLAPIVTINNPSGASATLGQSFTLNFSAAFPTGDTDGETISHLWINWGDGTAQQQYSPAATSEQHTYTSLGSDIVIVSVQDTDGVFSSAPFLIQVPGSGPVTSTPTFSATPVSGQEIQLTYSAPPGSQSEIEWFQPQNSNYPGDLNYQVLKQFTVVSSNSSQTTIAVTGLTPDTHYSFCLRTVNPGQSTPTFVTAAAHTPGKPTTLQAPIWLLNQSGVPNGMDFFWNAESDSTVANSTFSINEDFVSDPSFDPFGTADAIDSQGTGEFGTSPNGSNQYRSPFYEPDFPGSYQVDLQISDGNGAVSPWITVVMPPPDPSGIITGLQRNQNANGLSTFSWSFTGDGFGFLYYVYGLQADGSANLLDQGGAGPGGGTTFTTSNPIPASSFLNRAIVKCRG